MSVFKPQAVTENSFDQEVINAGQPVLVDFWAEWCGPCRMIAPALDHVAEDFGGKASVRKVDVDENQQLAARYGVRSIPTLMVFKDGEPVETLVGVQSHSTLSDALQRHV